jgi:hypothetical protein
VVTATPKGKSFFPWALRRLVYYFGGLSGITTALGIYRIVAFGMASLGYFGLVMNVIWPAFMLVGVCYALKLAWTEIRERKDIDGLFSCAWQGAGHHDWAPLKKWWSTLSDEIIQPLTTDWFKEAGQSFKNAYAYFKGGEY